MTPPNNRKMSTYFKKLGFKKSELQMTRVGLTYELIGDDRKALFTFGKGLNDNIMVSALDKDFPSVVIFSESKWEEIQANDFIFPHLLALEEKTALTPRTILLAMAAGYADMRGAK